MNLRRTLLALAVTLAVLPTTAASAQSPDLRIPAKKVKLTYKVERLLTAKTYKWSDLVSINSKGRQSWKVSGPCKVSKKAKTLTTTSKLDYCSMVINVARWKSYPATTVIAGLHVKEAPLVLPAPTISDTFPAAQKTSNRAGYFTLSMTGAMSKTATSSYDEATKLWSVPTVDCYATSTYVSHTMGVTHPDQTQTLASVKRDLSSDKSQTVILTVKLYDATGAKRTFVRRLTTPTAAATDTGSGDIRVSADGSGATFAAVLYEEDKNYNYNPASTLAVSGHLACTYP